MPFTIQCINIYDEKEEMRFPSLACGRSQFVHQVMGRFNQNFNARMWSYKVALIQSPPPPPCLRTPSHGPQYQHSYIYIYTIKWHHWEREAFPLWSCLFRVMGLIIEDVRWSVCCMPGYWLLVAPSDNIHCQHDGVRAHPTTMTVKINNSPNDMKHNEEETPKFRHV